MSLPIQEKIDLVIQCLKEGEVSYLDISGSFKVDLDTGHSVYVYSDIRANSFTARFETTEIDEDKRQADLETLHAELNRVITVAEVNPFQDSDHYGKRFVYTADLDFDGASRPNETAGVGDDAAGLNRPSPKALTLDQKIRMIVASLQSHGINFQDISGSLNVNVTGGLSVYIYSDISTNSIVARFESTQVDPDMRQTDAETISVALNFMLDKAVMSELQEVDPCGKRFVYISGIYFEGDAEYDSMQDDSIGIDATPDEADERDDLPAPSQPPPEPIKLTLENKHRIIKESLQARGIPFLDVASSFKVYLDADLSAYIYTDIYDNSIHVRYETKQTDQAGRLETLEILRDKLKQVVPGIDLDPFQEAASFGKKFVYTARLEFYAAAVQPPPVNTDTGDGAPEMDAAAKAMRSAVSRRSR